MSNNSTLPSEFYYPKCDKALALNEELYQFLFRSHLPGQYQKQVNKDVILQKKAKQMQEINKSTQKSFFSNFSFSKFFGKKSNHPSENIKFNDETEDIEDDEFFLVNRSDNPNIQEINPFGKFFTEEFYLDLFKNSIKLQEYLQPYITSIQNSLGLDQQNLLNNKLYKPLNKYSDSLLHSSTLSQFNFDVKQNFENLLLKCSACNHVDIGKNFALSFYKQIDYDARLSELPKRKKSVLKKPMICGTPFVDKWLLEISSIRGKINEDRKIFTDTLLLADLTDIYDIITKLKLGLENEIPANINADENAKYYHPKKESQTLKNIDDIIKYIINSISDEELEEYVKRCKRLKLMEYKYNNMSNEELKEYERVIRNFVSVINN